MIIQISNAHNKSIKTKLQYLVLACCSAVLLLSMAYSHISLKYKQTAHEQSLIQQEEAVKVKRIHDSWLNAESLNDAQTIIQYVKQAKYQNLDADQVRTVVTDLANYYKIRSPIEMSLQNIEHSSIDLDGPMHINNYLLTLRFNSIDDENIFGLLLSLLSNLNAATGLYSLDLTRNHKLDTNSFELNEEAPLSCIAQIRIQTFNDAKPTPKDFTAIINYNESNKELAKIEELYGVFFWKGSLMLDEQEKEMLRNYGLKNRG